MRTRTLRAWVWLHRCSSLICTVFLLMLCITGLPLIFHDEIEHLLSDHAPFTEVRSYQVRVKELVNKTEEIHRNHIPITILFNPEEPEIAVFTAPSWEEFYNDEAVMEWVSFDEGDGSERERSDSAGNASLGFMDFMLRLHVDMFLLLPGQMFLGIMGLMLLVAIISGVVLYGPFTRKLDFGTIRTTQSKSVRWLDIHNLFGITTAAWLTVVGGTGVLHEISFPLYQRYLATDVAKATAQWQGEMLLDGAELISVDSALETARNATPDNKPIALFYPRSRYGTPHHYMIWVQGRTPSTSRIQTSVLVDARTGELAAIVPQPWYLKAIQISRPLHFGDYGGMPLKIIWALLDLVTIVVLGSGLYLWFSKRRHINRETAKVDEPPVLLELAE